MKRWLLALPFLLGAGSMPASVGDVLVLTDGGPDDRVALRHLAGALPKALVGVVGTHQGDVPPARAVAAAKEALAGTGVPVIAGMDGPFGAEQDIKPGPTADFILARAKGHSADRPLTVLLLGPATDLALALVVDPALADRIQVVGRAFAGWPKGGDTENVRRDVEAWRIVLHGRAPVVIADNAVAARDLGADRDEAAVAWVLGMAEDEARPRPRLKNDATFEPSKNSAPFRWITKVDAERVRSR